MKYLPIVFLGLLLAGCQTTTGTFLKGFGCNQLLIQVEQEPEGSFRHTFLMRQFERYCIEAEDDPAV